MPTISCMRQDAALSNKSICRGNTGACKCYAARAVNPNKRSIMTDVDEAVDGLARDIKEFATRMNELNEALTTLVELLSERSRNRGAIPERRSAQIIGCANRPRCESDARQAQP